MLDNNMPALDPPDPDRVYRNHLERCQRLGIEPVPRERAAKLMAEWFHALAGRMTITPKPTTH